MKNSGAMGGEGGPPKVRAGKKPQKERFYMRTKHEWVPDCTCILFSSTTGPCWRSLTIVAWTTFLKAASCCTENISFRFYDS